MQLSHLYLTDHQLCALGKHYMYVFYLFFSRLLLYLASLAIFMASYVEIVSCCDHVHSIGLLWSYVRVVGIACYNRMSRGYILPPISYWGVWRRTTLEVVCNKHSPAPIYGGYHHGQVYIVVLVVHLVLSVLAALGICVGNM